MSPLPLTVWLLFEGPLLSLKEVNAIAHFTDWIVGHVHIGTLGWNGFLTFGVLYWLIPKLYKTKLYSLRLANVHFWLGTLGILFYSIPLYWAGFAQGSMWADFTETGQLQYANFLDTVTNLIPMYAMRGMGGLIYFTGACIMVFNLIKTVKQGTLEPDEAAEAPALLQNVKVHNHHWHSVIERRPIQMLIFALIAISIGGAVEIIPTFLVSENVPTISSVKPYTPLELEGRDIYIREGCNACHTQMVRPLRHEVVRYDPIDMEYSKAGEYVYDHPFLWGSKRTGPDLHREGGIKSNSWHFNHMNDPRSTSPGSIMPRYPWLQKDKLNTDDTDAKISAMVTLGVPYPAGYEREAVADLKEQADEIAADLNSSGIEVSSDKEIIALIGYLQRLGTDIKNKE